MKNFRKENQNIKELLFTLLTLSQTPILPSIPLLFLSFLFY
jgi:hypothetical protein